jgi:hypothetical protein
MPSGDPPFLAFLYCPGPFCAGCAGCSTGFGFGVRHGYKSPQYYEPTNPAFVPTLSEAQIEEIANRVVAKLKLAAPSDPFFAELLEQFNRHTFVDSASEIPPTAPEFGGTGVDLTNLVAK